MRLNPGRSTMSSCLLLRIVPEAGRQHNVSSIRRADRVGVPAWAWMFSGRAGMFSLVTEPTHPIPRFSALHVCCRVARSQTVSYPEHSFCGRSKGFGGARLPSRLPPAAERWCGSFFGKNAQFFPRMCSRNALNHKERSPARRPYLLLSDRFPASVYVLKMRHYVLLVDAGT